MWHSCAAASCHDGTDMTALGKVVKPYGFIADVADRESGDAFQAGRGGGGPVLRLPAGIGRERPAAPKPLRFYPYRSNVAAPHGENIPPRPAKGPVTALRRRLSLTKPGCDAGMSRTGRDAATKSTKSSLRQKRTLYPNQRRFGLVAFVSDPTLVVLGGELPEYPYGKEKANGHRTS